MKYQDLENGAMRELTAEEVCAMYHFHDEYAELGLGAIEYYTGLSARDKQYIKDMTAEEFLAAQQSAQPTVATEPLEDSPWQTGARRGAVIPSNRNSG